MVTQENLSLDNFAKQIRYYTLQELNHLGFGHYGGSLSIVECLAVLYGKEMKIDPQDPIMEDRDFFVLSKGHAGPALYATLYLKGFISLDELYSLNQNGTNLPSHPDMNKTCGVDATTGSLGQGISIATGIAYGNRLKGLTNQTYCIVGDGELGEGQCWEALQFASSRKLSNLTIFIDNNGKQLDGYTKDIAPQELLYEKMKAFGFACEEVDGSNCASIDAAVKKAKANRELCTVIILNTIKGQGVPYLENLEANHHIRPTEEQRKAIEEAVNLLEKEMEEE